MSKPPNFALGSLFAIALLIGIQYPQIFGLVTLAASIAVFGRLEFDRNSHDVNFYFTGEVSNSFRRWVKTYAVLEVIGRSVIWRVVHLLAIGVVVVQAWLGRYCGLTVLESNLREMAGQVGYERSFIEYWAQRLLYYEGPLWAFAFVYTVFGALVVWSWCRYPPRPRHAARRDT